MGLAKRIIPCLDVNNSRVVKGVTSLIDNKQVTPFNTWTDSKVLTRNKPLQEASRIANILIEKGVFDCR